MRNSIRKSLVNGRISEIYEFAKNYFGEEPSNISATNKLMVLCEAMCITPNDLDEVISKHSEVSRTVKGHAFEVVFDTMMNHNGVECKEIGGDTDVDREINGKSLQLKTQYQAGCSGAIVSYKTHKTHGAKSEEESLDYYHRVDDFADYLVGLVSYHPFTVLIVPKEHLPLVSGHGDYILSPMFLHTEGSPFLNSYSYLGINRPMEFPEELLVRSENECLPKSSALLDLRSDYILRAIFIKDNFRIWDMNMRGFIREHVLHSMIEEHGSVVYPPSVTALPRYDKSDLVLKTTDDRFVRFQVKGLTWKGCKLHRGAAVIDCETQLSRGRVNDHPTQSRLYMASDFESVIIAVDPPYTNALTKATFGQEDYSWSFYCVPQSRLTKHHKHTNRVASHQYIPFEELQQYRIDENWFAQWKKEG